MKTTLWTKPYENRRSFIGGSDARIIMGSDEAALIRLWREKRGEIEPEDLSGNLIVQLGTATEELNRSWYERNSGRQVVDVQRRVKHSAIPWMAATLDGMVEGSGAVFEAKFMLPWSFSEEAAAEKHMAQVQHNMWVTHLRSAVLSIITGGGKWVEITIPMDPLYLSVLVSAEKKFWRCVQSGRAAASDQCRAAAAAHRGDPHRRHELLQQLGGVRGAVPQHPAGLSRARAGQDRAQGADAGGCQGGDRPWGAGQALEVRRRELRCPGRRRSPMPRSSESVAALAAALAKAQAELVNPEKSLTATIRSGRPGEGRAHLPLCVARQRARHRAQDARPARDRHRADHRDRSGGRAGQPDHHAGPCLRRMDRLGLAGLPDRRHGEPAPHGSRADLRPPLRAVHAGRHRRRG